MYKKDKNLYENWYLFIAHTIKLNRKPCGHTHRWKRCLHLLTKCSMVQPIYRQNTPSFSVNNSDQNTQISIHKYNYAVAQVKKETTTLARKE